MFVARVLSSSSRGISSLLSPSHIQQSQILSNGFHSLCESSNKLATSQASLFNSSIVQQFGMSSCASPKPTKDGSTKLPKTSGHAKSSAQTRDISSGKTIVIQQAKEPSSSSKSKPFVSQFIQKRRDIEEAALFDLDLKVKNNKRRDDLAKFVAVRKELVNLSSKFKEILRAQEKILRCIAKMEDDLDKAKQEISATAGFPILTTLLYVIVAIFIFIK